MGIINIDIISRQAAIDALCGELCGGHHDCEFYPTCNEIHTIIELPSIQPKRGRWIAAESQCGIKCSNCGYPVDDFCHSIDYIDLDYAPNFCPNCGVDMREVIT